MTARTVLMSVPDLFFSTRITSTADQLGVAVEACAPAQLASRAAAVAPGLIIVDLHAPGSIAAVHALRARPATRDLPVVGFYSHVDTALRTAAIDAGVTFVLPRSAFTVKLAALLAGGDTPV